MSFKIVNVWNYHQWTHYIKIILIQYRHKGSDDDSVGPFCVAKAHSPCHCTCKIPFSSLNIDNWLKCPILMLFRISFSTKIKKETLNSDDSIFYRMLLCPVWHGFFKASVAPLNDLRFWWKFTGLILIPSLTTNSMSKLIA